MGILNYIADYLPGLVILENTDTMESACDVLDEILAALAKHGYMTCCIKLNSNVCASPQNRNRLWYCAVLVGDRLDHAREALFRLGIRDAIAATTSDDLVVSLSEYCVPNTHKQVEKFIKHRSECKRHKSGENWIFDHASSG